ncbi:hypothetical protein GF369_01055 [Candidatus Peregrinibacteria bacterium]|nr:hypothetical protein [Candidatus Peregrinibacteria bacterium]
MGIGMLLTVTLLLFGSYMNEEGASLTHASMVSYEGFGAAHSVSGLVYDMESGFPKQALSVPSTIVMLIGTDKMYDAPGIITIDPDHTSFIDERHMYRKAIVDLLNQEYVGVYEQAFIEDSKVSSMVREIRNTYPSARLIPLIVQHDFEKADPYRLSRRLATFAGNKRESIAIITGVSHVQSDHEAINVLRDTTFKRTLYNQDITLVDTLALNNTGVLKAFLYTMHFMNLDATQGDVSYTLFNKGNRVAHETPITLLAFGDMMLDRHVRSLMDTHGHAYPFEKIQSDLDGIDFVFTNFEGPIKEIEVPTQKSISFNFKPDVVWPVKNAGITIVSIANNHSLDQGWAGRDDTMKFLDEAGIHYFGHPKNSAEENVYIGQIGDKTIAFVGFDDTIFRIDPVHAEAMIEELQSITDYIIVSVHWGREYVHQPTERKQMLGHTFIDAGADVVLGHHPHVVQTMEIYDGKPIFYSLGNFIFDQYFSQDTQEGLGVAMILKEEEIQFYLLPYSIDASQPELMKAQAKTQFLEKFIRWGDYKKEDVSDIRKGVITVPQN